MKIEQTKDDITYDNLYESKEYITNIDDEWNLDDVIQEHDINVYDYNKINIYDDKNKINNIYDD